MNRGLYAESAPRAQWLRLGLFASVLLACVLVPFALWGDVLDRAAPAWLSAQDARLWLAMLGIALLMADVVLPLPSSVIGMLLCWGLGPLWGGLAVASGCLLAFALGYVLGRVLPETRLRRWVGAALWDRARNTAQRRALWWIAAARPLPVLAELSALLAGVWRLPPLAAFAHAAWSSCAVGALYGASAWLGLSEPHPAAMLPAMLALPAAMWLVHRILLRRLLADAGSAVSREHDQGGVAP